MVVLPHHKRSRVSLAVQRFLCSLVECQLLHIWKRCEKHAFNVAHWWNLALFSWKYTWNFCYAFTSTMDWSHKISVTQWNDLMDESAIDTAHRRVHCKILSNAAILSFCWNAVHTIGIVTLIAAFLESLCDDRVKILIAVVLQIQFCIRGSVETRCYCFEMLQYLTTAN